MKRNILVAVLLVLSEISFCNYPVHAEENTQLTWVQMETEEKVSEVILPENDKADSPKTNIPTEQKDESDEVKSEDSDYLEDAIKEIMKRRQADDKLLNDLLNKQKVVEKAKKEQEEAQKRREETQKKQEQQKLLENLTQTLQKQKDEENQKLEATLKVLTEQQTAQTNNVNALINALQNEREQRQQEQQTILNEAANISANATNANNYIQIAPLPAANNSTNITPLAKKSFQESIASSTQDVTKTAFAEADATFFYTSGSLYKFYCREGFVTDVRLQPGEEIQYIGGGDTVRWVIDQAQSGSGDDKVWHIYLKPLQSGLVTNIIINTDKHSYQLHVESADWYTPIVKWTYPQEEKSAFYRTQAIEERHSEENLGAISLESLNFSYKITKGESYDWAPTEIFDDGTKIYLKMPESMSKSNAPVLFVKDGKNLAMVNYRLKNGMYVVDRLFKEAELRSGNETVRIKKR